MHASVVTIAMSDGALAEAIARLAADRLGYRYVNDQIIDQAAAQAGVTRESVAEVERRQSLITRIITALAASTPAELGAVGVREPPPWSDPSPQYRALIQEVIRQTAAEGRVVIGAHGAGVLLTGLPDVLRVSVTGSAATRTTRLAATEGIDAAEAERLVARGDKARADYLRRFFNVRDEQPTHYDLVINSDRLPPELAATVIATAAGSVTAAVAP